MITKSALRELAKRIAHDVEQGGREVQARDLGVALASETGAVSSLMELIAMESGRKRPSAKDTASYLTALGLMLEAISRGVEQDRPEALLRADAARRSFLAQMTLGTLRGIALLRVIRLFAEARLRAGETLRTAVGSLIRPPAAPAGATARKDNPEGVAAALSGDVFRIQAELSAQASAFPVEARAGLARALIDSSNPRLREAAVGWLLDDDPATRIAASEVLRRAAVSGSVSRLMLRRMITVRNWIPAQERPGLDGAILLARQAGVEIEPVRPVAIKAVYVSGFDGLGVQSLVALARDACQHAALSALFAWTTASATRGSEQA